MMKADFDTSVSGKFIVAGEHAVLRGSPALAFPYTGKNLRLRHESLRKPLEIRSTQGEQEELVLSAVLEKALSLVEHKRSELKDTLLIENTIPVGAGLGASAALCVSVARLLVWKGWLNENKIQDFARELENIFHGESSGVDIAVALTGQPIIFERGTTPRVFAPKWWPNWKLSFCGSRGMTIDTIKKVKELWAQNEERALMIDHQMRSSVAEAVEALSSNEKIGLPLLQKSIERAGQCFKNWGLTDGILDQQIGRIMSDGAMAAKPTGSGAGGYILSLWSEVEKPTATSSYLEDFSHDMRTLQLRPRPSH